MMSYYLGIDAGSSYIKLALVDETETMAFRDVVRRGADIDASCRAGFDGLLRRHSIEEGQVERIIATGYGRNQVTFSDEVITEITALAIGAHAIDRTVRCVIDIGGQDSKVIVVDRAGRVLDFMMNHKCAAGTGKFLEVTSASLGVAAEQLGAVSRRSKKVLKLSSTCTVFAESEVVSCVARGEKTEDIIKALHRTIAAQARSLLYQLDAVSEGTTAFVGGLAMNVGMVDELSATLTEAILVPLHPQFVGAYGAALLSKRKMAAALPM